MQNTRFTPCGTRVCAIKILSYEDKNPRGILSNQNLEGDVPFDSMAELLFAMEALFDDIGSPQRTLKPRGYVKTIPETTEQESSAKPLATFLVDVMFRQNASWQGNIVWTEKKQESQFRSVLELIMLMDNILRPDEKEAIA